MPALYTLWNTRWEKRWAVGSDDFVVPPLVAIAVRLVCFCAIAGTLFYLYFAPFKCDLESLPAVPPFLYGTLFAVLFLELVVLINDTIILSISSRGKIEYERPNTLEHEVGKKGWPDPDRYSPRRPLKNYLYFRIFLFALEVAALVVLTVAVSSPTVEEELQACEAYSGPLWLARGVVITLWVALIAFVIGLLIFLDPLGCCTPALLTHRVSLDQQGTKRRLQRLCCCLGVRGNRSRNIALQDVSVVFYALFGDVDIVATDVATGLILLNKSQTQRLHSGDSLVDQFKKLTFEKMADNLKPPGYRLQDCAETKREVDFKNAEEYLLFEDLIYYTHYALGMYGWPLYVFMNLSCGFCELGAKSCSHCYCCALKQRERERDFIGDDCCFCGITSLTLQAPTHLHERDIRFFTLRDEIFETPFSICVDHKKKSVVISVRGTLSMKDALTDVTIVAEQMDDTVPGVDPDQARVHSGMFRTALWIKNQLLNEAVPRLKQVTDDNPDYQLVVTGHSLGAGVASILAVLLKPQFPDLVCYVFSPPGCTFSFPLTVYSREFTTSVVLGSDMVGRMTFRALCYLKSEVMFLLRACEKPKYQVLYQPQDCDRCCNFCCKNVRNPTVDLKDVESEFFPEQPNDYASPAQENQPLIPPRAPGEKKSPSLLRWTVERSEQKSNSHPVVQGVLMEKDFESVPLFPPGKVIHIEVQERVKSCWLASCNPPRFSAFWINSEDLSVIIVDKEMGEDHLPNRVQHAMVKCMQQHTAAVEDTTSFRRMQWGRADETQHKINTRKIVLEEEMANRHVHGTAC